MKYTQETQRTESVREGWRAGRQREASSRLEGAQRREASCEDERWWFDAAHLPEGPCPEGEDGGTDSAGSCEGGRRGPTRETGGHHLLDLPPARPSSGFRVVPRRWLLPRLFCGPNFPSRPPAQHDLSGLVIYLAPLPTWTQKSRQAWHRSALPREACPLSA